MSLPSHHEAARELLEAERLCLEARVELELEGNEETMRRLVSARERLTKAEQALEAAGIRVIRA